MISFIWKDCYWGVNVRVNTGGDPHIGDATVIGVKKSKNSKKFSFWCFPFCRIIHIFRILQKSETKIKGPILLRQSPPPPLICPNFSPEGFFSVSLLKSRRWELVVDFSLQLIPRSSPFVFGALHSSWFLLFSSLHLSFLSPKAMAEIGMLSFSSFEIKEMGTGHGVLFVAFYLDQNCFSPGLDLCFFMFFSSSGLDLSCVNAQVCSLNLCQISDSRFWSLIFAFRSLKIWMWSTLKGNDILS